MLEKNNSYKILKIFLDSPTDSFRLRELSRISKISPPSVMNYLKEFKDKGLIESYTKRGIPFYRAVLDNEDFRVYKKISTIYEIHKSGLDDYLWDKIHPDAIILYGSHIRGESTENSDLDIFIIGKERKLDLEVFKKRLGKTIHIMFKEGPEKISKELKNNLINGFVLKGYFKVF